MPIVAICQYSPAFWHFPLKCLLSPLFLYQVQVPHEIYLTFFSTLSLRHIYEPGLWSSIKIFKSSLLESYRRLFCSQVQQMSTKFSWSTKQSLCQDSSSPYVPLCPICHCNIFVIMFIIHSNNQNTMCLMIISISKCFSLQNVLFLF